MTAVRIRFYADLRDFLPVNRRQGMITLPLDRRASVKDVIESLGVPHTEIGLILANGESVDFSYLVEPGDRISVYPHFASIDVATLARLRPDLPLEPRFVLDTHLGKLASYLRMLGFDSLYRNDYDDGTLAGLSSGEGRILLTRDRGLLKRSEVIHGYYVREQDPERQVAEIVRRFDLYEKVSPLGRCLRCNGLLTSVSKEAIRDRLEPKTRRYYDEFYACSSCGRIYWKGSHHEHMRQFLERVLRDGWSVDELARPDIEVGDQ